MTDAAGTDASDRALQGLTEAAAALVSPYDVVGTVTRLLIAAAASADAAAAGLIVRLTAADQLELLAATSHRAEELEAYQAQHRGGPCFEAAETGLPVVAHSRDQIQDRWPAVAPAFNRAGYMAVQAIPLHWDNHVIGALNLFWSIEIAGASGRLAGDVFADMATLAIMHSGTVSAAEVQRRTRAALDERTVIEQAKGVLAQQRRLSMDAAYGILLDMARREGQLIRATALAVIAGAAAESRRQSR